MLRWIAGSCQGHANASFSQLKRQPQRGQMDSSQIKVSLVIPARNEEKHIGACLDSILANDFPATSLEVLVVNGMSTDRTAEIVSGYALRHPFIRLLQNPRRIIPSALNTGILAAQGEIIVRMDAHSTYASDYIRKAVEDLETTGAAMVGSVQRPVSDSPITYAIAAATCSRFGVGNSYQHFSTESRWVEDSVYLGTWKKQTLLQLGGFDESWEINEDSELIHRLCQAGGKVWLSTRLISSYRVRSSLKSLARQYFRYGKWRARTFLTHPSSLRLRQLAAPALLASLPVSAGLAGRFGVLAFAPILTYLLGNMVVSAKVVTRQGWRCALVPIAFCTLHFSWGTGFWTGLFRFGPSRLLDNFKGNPSRQMQTETEANTAVRPQDNP